MAIRIGWDRPATTIENSLQGQPLSLMEFESPSLAVIEEPVSLGSRSAIWWISAMMFCMLMIAAFTPTDIVVTASGKMVSTADTQIIAPLDLSIIKSINVRVGQIVRKGQLLATLDPTLPAADSDAYRKQVAELTPELLRLNAEKNKGQYIPRDINDPNQELQLKEFQQDSAHRVAMDANYDQQIASLEQQISGNLAQAAYYKERLGIASDVEGLRKQEETMYVGSKLNSLEAADTRVSMEGSMQQAIAAAQSEKATLAATQAQKASDDANADATLMQTISTTQPMLDTAIQNLQKANVHTSLVEMRAPVDSIVLQIEKLSTGAVLQPAEQFIQLTPLDKPLQAEAYISGTDIGWVQPGDYSEIKFSTFMYSEYGDARGHVTTVTTDSFVAPGSGSPNVPMIVSNATDDPSSTVPQSSTMSPIVNVFYVAKVAIDRMALRHVPADFRLLPGMPLTVDIKVGWRTYLDYCFSRIAPVFNEAMREP